MNKYLEMMKRIMVEEVEWEYIATGKGKSAFVIFPGGGQTAQSNFRLIEAFQDKFKVIAVNIYNCDSIDDFCDAVDEILKKEKVKNINLYGLSMGGILAQSYLLRNKDRVEKIIISHSCTPNSITYKYKVIFPLKLLNIFLPVIPLGFIKWCARTFARIAQGGSNKTHFDFLNKLEPRIVELNKEFLYEFRNKYFTKRLLKTWISIHEDFYSNERFDVGTFKDWRGRVLIIKTDNDPLMQDEGDFEKVYSKAKVIMLSGTGHLSFYYKFEEIVGEIKLFLKS